MDTIGFIGGGNMAEAMIRGIISAHVFDRGNIYVSDIRHDRLSEMAQRYGVLTFDDNADIAAKADIVVLSIKPQTTNDALESIKGHIKPDALVISIVAGKRIANITSVIGDAAVVRVMPNTPALIDEGASVLFANEAAKSKLDKARLIFLCIGESLVVDDEDLIDAVTAVSGSGPAYFFLLMHEMIKTAVKLGISEHMARTLVLQTAKGSSLLAVQANHDGESPADLSRKVATPGGTTEAAFNVFHEGNFGQLVENALTAACTRSRELSNP